MKTQVLLIVFLMSIVPLLSGMPEIDALVEKSLDADPRIKDLRNQVKSAELEYDAQRMNFGPVVATSMKEYFNDAFDEESGDYTKLKLETRLEQNLVRLLWIRPSTKRKYLLELEVARERLRREELRKSAAIHARFLELLVAMARAETHAGLDSLAAAGFGAAKHLYYHGDILRPEFLRKQMESEDEHAARLQAEMEARTLLEAFCRDTGLSQAQLPLDSARGRLFVPDLDVLIAEALQVHSDSVLVTISAGIRDADNDIWLFNRLDWRIYAGLDWWLADSDSDRSAPSAGMNFSFPLAYFSMKSDRSKQNKLHHEQARLDLAMEKQRLTGELGLAHARCVEALIQRQRLQRLLTVAEEDFLLSRKRTDVPVTSVKTTMDDYREAHETFLKARMRLDLAMFEETRQILGLAKLAGLPIAFFQNPGISLEPDNRHPNAVWVWDAGELLADPGRVDLLIRDCRDMQAGQVYLSLGQTLLAGLSDDTVRRAAFARLYRAGIRPSVLLSENTWLLPEKRERLIAVIRELLRYQQSVPRDERFSALHLDLEPQGLPLWESTPLTGLEYLRETLVTVREQVGGRLPVIADISVLNDEVDPGWLQKVSGLADGFVLMAYQKNMQSLLDKSYNELSHFEKTGTPVIVGINVKNYDRSEKMTDDIVLLRNKFEAFTVFGGFAFHDYRAYRQMRGVQ